MCDTHDFKIAMYKTVLTFAKAEQKIRRKIMKHNLCVIGYGGMGGGFHAKNALTSDVVNLAGIYDIDPAKCEQARANGIHVYESIQEVIDDKSVDLVTVAIPNDSHRDAVVKSLLGVKNVICEKPVAMSSKELQEMIDASKKSGKLFTVHQNRRWDVDFLAMKKIHDSGEIGRIFNIESRIHGSRGIPSDWRGEKAHGGGMLLDWGVHLIDQILQIYTEKIEKIYCRFDHLTNKEVDDNVQLNIYFEGGARAYVEVGTYNFISLPRFYMQGEKGTALIRDWREKTQVVKCKAWHESDVVPIQTAAGLTKTMAPRDEITTDTYEVDRPTSDVHDFYRNVCAAIDGKESLLVTHDQVMRVFKVMEAAFESAETGNPVYFPEKL